MKNMSRKVKIMGIVAICLWMIGSFLIYKGTNGESIGISTAVIILTGLYSQVRKDQKENSEH